MTSIRGRAKLAIVAAAAGLACACAGTPMEAPVPSWRPDRFPFTGRWTIPRPRHALRYARLNVAEGRYLLRFATDRPSTLKVTLLSGSPLPVLGGFDLPTPVCVAVPLSGEVYMEVRPIGDPPGWIDLVVEETTRDASPGPARWTCPAPAASPPAP
jgi:hypothetical protein